MSKIIIANVLYTNTDETFYVNNGLSKYAEKYAGTSIIDTFQKLKDDGWDKCGKVNRSAGSLADMFVKNNQYIALWEE